MRYVQYTTHAMVALFDIMSDDEASRCRTETRRSEVWLVTRGLDRIDGLRQYVFVFDCINKGRSFTPSLGSWIFSCLIFVPFLCFPLTLSADRVDSSNTVTMFRFLMPQQSLYTFAYISVSLVADLAASLSKLLSPRLADTPLTMSEADSGVVLSSHLP